MIDEAPHWLDTFLRMFDRALEHGALVSILLGYGISIGLVQWVKLLPLYPNNKWAIRTLALPFGFITTWFLWPVDTFNAVRFFMALFVGVSSPWIYWLVMRLVYWKWPHLERRFSANPKLVEAEEQQP